ncbi:hypothetical protein HYALB_00007007 [Hymenoscyphus albidus]|uniref:Mediator of RNA polymerase II transcription subunit 6 n=1 Tax=Hymenoscyphus albidus TaxID=595503 RepID=A0A9N9LRQ6_9HELO|nr:hypothetical protein HYALB_00007007 [Hymenoscyphus albidus]
MAAQDPPLDEMQWRSPPIAAEMQGIHSNSVLFYFARSPFFDGTSNNAVLFNQAMFNQNMLPIIQTREAFEGRLKTMSGLEFIVAQEPADMVTGTGVWVIRKQRRLKRPGQEDQLEVLSTYFVVGENVYMAPAVSDVLASRTLSILTSLNKFYTKAASLPNFTPAIGSSYIPPPTGRTTVAQTQLGQASKENTPLPDSQTTKKAGLPSPDNSAYLLLNESIRTTMRYESDYMDENPITGEPGAFHFSNSGRIEKDSNRLATPASAPLNTAAIGGKTPTQPPPPLKTDIEPVKKMKGEKTPTKSPGVGKMRRKKSKSHITTGPISPTT